MNSALQAVIAYYNAQRGHRREGFLDLPMPKEGGGLGYVRESSNDKANRLEHELKQAGRSLSRISEADCAALLHKVRRVTVKANGARVRIGGTERLYWHEGSLAIVAAQQSSLREKEISRALQSRRPARALPVPQSARHGARDGGSLARRVRAAFL